MRWPFIFFTAIAVLSVAVDGGVFSKTNPKTNKNSRIQPTAPPPPPVRGGTSKKGRTWFNQNSTATATSRPQDKGKCYMTQPGTPKVVPVDQINTQVGGRLQPSTPIFSLCITYCVTNKATAGVECVTGGFGGYVSLQWKVSQRDAQRDLGKRILPGVFKSFGNHFTATTHDDSFAYVCEVNKVTSGTGGTTKSKLGSTGTGAYCGPNPGRHKYKLTFVLQGAPQYVEPTEKWEDESELEHIDREKVYASQQNVDIYDYDGGCYLGAAITLIAMAMLL